MSPPKVAICVPYYRDVDGATLLSCMEMMAYSAMSLSMMVVGCSGCYVEDNRNGAVEYAISTGIPFDWLFWIDADMKFPRDTLTRLIAHNKDIVGANYRTRTPPFGFAGHYLDGSDANILTPGLHQMGHLPTGMLLTRFDIYRKLAYPWFKAGNRGEPRDDVYFCAYARANGFEVWCDHDLTFEIAHCGRQEIPWFSKDQVIFTEGAQLNLDKNRVAAQERAALTRQEYDSQNMAAD